MHGFCLLPADAVYHDKDVTFVPCFHNRPHSFVLVFSGYGFVLIDTPLHPNKSGIRLQDHKYLHHRSQAFFLLNGGKFIF